MKIALLVPRCGPDGPQNIGDEIEVTAEEAPRMFDAQPPQAAPVRSGKRETATRKVKGEKAAQ